MAALFARGENLKLNQKSIKGAELQKLCYVLTMKL